MSTIMETRTGHFTGAFVAECPRCHKVCAYWDEEDLDEEGNLLCFCDVLPDSAPMASCRHCGRTIFYDEIDGWIDPEATGDDSVWRETCDEHDTFEARHEPEEDE